MDQQSYPAQFLKSFSEQPISCNCVFEHFISATSCFFNLLPYVVFKKVSCVVLFVNQLQR